MDFSEELKLINPPVDTPTLSQSDIEVWLQALYLAQGSLLGNAIFWEVNFLRQLGWNTGREEIQYLSNSLDRLAKNTLTIQKRDHKKIVVPLLDKITGGSGVPYRLLFHPDFFALFFSRPFCSQEKWPQYRRSLVVQFYNASQLN